MTLTQLKKRLSMIVCTALIAAMALTATACGSKESGGVGSSDAQVETQSQAATSITDDTSDLTVLGEGETQFLFNVTDKDGKETKFEIHTDKTTVGEALLELGLIEGEDSEYGLYVKTVNGITADFNTDGVYWAFYIDGEYATTGVDQTDINAGSTYAFKVE